MVNVPYGSQYLFESVSILAGLRQIQGIRPKVKLNGMQRRNLEKYLSTVSKTP